MDAKDYNRTSAGGVSCDATHFVARYSAFVQGVWCLPLLWLPFSLLQVRAYACR
jgi:hypothetical protein